MSSDSPGMEDSPKEQVRFSKMERQEGLGRGGKHPPSTVNVGWRGTESVQSTGFLWELGQFYARPGGGDPCVGHRRLPSGSIG